MNSDVLLLPKSSRVLEALFKKEWTSSRKIKPDFNIKNLFRKRKKHEDKSATCRCTGVKCLPVVIRCAMATDKQATSFFKAGKGARGGGMGL